MHHQACRYKTIFIECCSRAGKIPSIVRSCCVVSLLTWLQQQSLRVTKCKGWVRVDVVFTLWHSVERWSYVAIGGDDAANDAPFSS